MPKDEMPTVETKVQESGSEIYLSKGPFFIRLTGKSNGGSAWDSTITDIYNHEKKHLGNFTREYPNYGDTTFCPFKLGEQWYALYSDDYEKTRVMTLPDCQFLCEPEDDSFCPVEHYVPQYRILKLDMGDGSYSFLYEWDNDRDRMDIEGYSQWSVHQDWTYADFGFVSGCHWGDDSSWKVWFLDLSGLRTGAVVRKFPKFGFPELAPGRDLPSSLIFSSDVCDEIPDGRPDSVRIIQEIYYPL